MNEKIILACQLLVWAVLLSGCSTQPTTLEADFGKSVRSVMNSQIHDREAAANPDPDAVEGGDPYRLDTALETHRTDVSKPQAVQQPISISVGSK